MLYKNSFVSISQKCKSQMEIFFFKNYGLKILNQMKAKRRQKMQRSYCICPCLVKTDLTIIIMNVKLEKNINNLFRFWFRGVRKLNIRKLLNCFHFNFLTPLNKKPNKFSVYNNE